VTHVDVSCRYLVLKDSFVAYLRPDEGTVSDVLLMDQDVRVQSGISATGFRNGLLISNLSRFRHLTCHFTVLFCLANGEWLNVLDDLWFVWPSVLLPSVL